MATNLATDSLKSVMSKAATGPTSSVATSDSAVAEFRDHQHPHQNTQGDDATSGTTTQHSAATLSDSAVAELKAAYVAVEQAIADAKSGSTETTSGTTDTVSTGTASTDKAADAPTHQPPADPLVKVLADATGETTATVQGVLEQVRAVLHQEHLSDASGKTGTTDTTPDAGTSTGTSTGISTGTSTGTATSTSSITTDDAKAGDAPHWHDRLIAQHDGNGATGPTDAAGSTLWQHFLNHYATADSAVTGNADVVAAVDGFVDTVQSLHLDPGHGQMHGHGTDGVHLDTAA